MHFILYGAIIIITLSLTALFEYRLIPILKSRANQPIYEGGPVWHLSKSGTPTMGGIAFLLAAIILLIPTSIVLIRHSDYKKIGTALLISVVYAAANSIIGIFDDLTKLRKKANAGLTPMQKIFFQSILAIIFLMSRAHFMGDCDVISFSFGEINIGFLYYPIAMIMLIGIVNCANLTDGIDGLASTVAFTIGIILVLMCKDTFTDAAVIGAALIGTSVGFLIFNIHPAKIFMGDTGSLFLGALAISASFSLGNPLLMIPLGSVYVIEGVSVISQVVCFKLTGKRLLKMAPLHHHLEKCGMSECKICMIAIIVTLLFAIPAFVISPI